MTPADPPASGSDPRGGKPWDPDPRRWLHDHGQGGLLWTLPDHVPEEGEESGLGSTTPLMGPPELYRTEARLETYRREVRRATSDRLTGLMNRNGIEDYLDYAAAGLANPNAGSQAVSILAIDFIGLKHFNDDYSPQQQLGDHLLQVFGIALKDTVSSLGWAEPGEGGVRAARPGGDEFLLMGRRDFSAADIDLLRTALAERFTEILVHGHPKLLSRADRLAGATPAEVAERFLDRPNKSRRGTTLRDDAVGFRFGQATTSYQPGSLPAFTRAMLDEQLEAANTQMEAAKLPERRSESGSFDELNGRRFWTRRDEIVIYGESANLVRSRGAQTWDQAIERGRERTVDVLGHGHPRAERRHVPAIPWENVENPREACRAIGALVGKLHGSELSVETNVRNDEVSNRWDRLADSVQDDEQLAPLFAKALPRLKRLDKIRHVPQVVGRTHGEIDPVSVEWTASGPRFAEHPRRDRGPVAADVHGFDYTFTEPGFFSQFAKGQITPAQARLAFREGYLSTLRAMGRDTHVVVESLRQSDADHLAEELIEVRADRSHEANATVVRALRNDIETFLGTAPPRHSARDAVQQARGAARDALTVSVGSDAGSRQREAAQLTIPGTEISGQRTGRASAGRGGAGLGF